MKKIFVLMICLSVSLALSCKKADSTVQETVDMPKFQIDDGKNNEVILDTEKFENSLPPVRTFGEQPEATTYTDKDGSSVRISYDSEGNKLERRDFFNHPNLKFLMVTTTADGNREGHVFGHNGERKVLPAELSEKALVVPGNDIATRVGITTTVQTYAAKPKRVTIPNEYPPIADPRINQMQQQTQSQPVPVETATETTAPVSTRASERKSNDNDN